MKKPRFHFTSVRQKLFAGVMLTSLVALIIAGTSLFVYDLRGYRASSSNDLTIEADLLGHVTMAALQFDDRRAAQQNLAFMSARPTIRAAAIYDPGGALFASYRRPGVEAAEIPAIPGMSQTRIEGDRLEVFRSVMVDKDVIGIVYLSQDLGMYKRVESYIAIAVGVVLVGLVVSTSLSAWLQKGITEPIIEIASLARDVVEKRDYAVRAHRTTHDEIGTLVDAFNEMLSEIQRRTSALESSSEEVGRLNKDLERRVGDRTQQLEESNLQLHGANVAKSSFLSMMSHEIRTPMNGVLGMLELLSLTELDAHQRNTLEIVRDSGRSLLRIIDDILDFSKIEAGKLEIRPEVASVARVVASVAAIYSGNASTKALVLKSHVDPRISPAVVVDPVRLQQILNNLVSNAIKFTDKGFVEIGAELFERRDGEDVVHFSVTDTGMGISPEGLSGLFQPFTQAGGTTRAFGGTGLGLSIGQRLARLMGGSIDISSELGKGTKATLKIPLPIADADLLPTAGGRAGEDAVAAAIIARRAEPSLAEAESEHTLVLVVDDHPINRLVLMRQVSALGYANEAAQDGREALELWKSGRFSLVITDCNMPEMDGYDLARSIRAIEASTGRERITIIACTANALKGEADNCFAAGMDDYVSKPVELPTLMAKLDEWLPIPAARMRAAQAPAALDWSVLDEIAGGDESLEGEILSRFLDVNRLDVALLRRALATRDTEQVVHAAHRIKGASRTIGANALAEVCAAIEAAARLGDWTTISANEAAFDREAARLNAYLAAASHPTSAPQFSRGQDGTS